jgi:hypothetical protein
MTPCTQDDRRRELETLLARIREHPERHWSEERYRIGVLATQLAAAQELRAHP